MRTVWPRSTNGCESGTSGTRLDFFDVKDPKVGPPPVCLEQRVMIRAEYAGSALPVNRGGERGRGPRR
jgi:hypothetical protein